ncbi:MAG: hypothetical protein KatS3mg035_0321 [Bacteroidia bacterium]|nr:MAG: hypothetical protein KatS3mg035_0321 [Bacteroidia bacterium]
MKLVSKKCPYCGQWSDYQDNIHEECYFCLQPLDPGSVQDLKNYEQKGKEYYPKLFEPFFPIKANDFWLVKRIKQILNLIGLVYVSIVSFIIAVIALLPG